MIGNPDDLQSIYNVLALLRRFGMSRVRRHDLVMSVVDDETSRAWAALVERGIFAVFDAGTGPCRSSFFVLSLRERGHQELRIQGLCENHPCTGGLHVR